MLVFVLVSFAWALPAAGNTKAASATLKTQSTEPKVPLSSGTPIAIAIEQPQEALHCCVCPPQVHQMECREEAYPTVIERPPHPVIHGGDAQIRQAAYSTHPRVIQAHQPPRRSSSSCYCCRGPSTSVNVIIIDNNDRHNTVNGQQSSESTCCGAQWGCGAGGCCNAVPCGVSCPQINTGSCNSGCCFGNPCGNGITSATNALPQVNTGSCNTGCCFGNPCGSAVASATNALPQVNSGSCNSGCCIINSCGNAVASATNALSQASGSCNSGCCIINSCGNGITSASAACSQVDVGSCDAASCAEGLAALANICMACLQCVGEVVDAFGQVNV